MERKRIVSNIYGQVSSFAKEMVTSLEQVYPGDHLTYERAKLYWHHVIIEDINSEMNAITIIHYHNDIKDFFEDFSLRNQSLAKVKRDTLQFWSERFYRVVYNNEICHPPEKVLELAWARLGEAQYSPLTGNCEHFCTYCKIGKNVSIQVECLVENTLASVLPPLTRVLLELLLKKAIQESIKQLSKDTTKNFCAEILKKSYQMVFQIAMMRCVGFVGARMAWVLLQQNIRVVVEGVVAAEARKICGTGAKEVFKAAARRLGTKVVSEDTSPRRPRCRMTKSGILASVAIEVAFAGKNIRDASKKRSAGEISKEEFEEIVIKRVVGASVCVPMSLAGSVVGQYVLPIPIVGNVIGGITGSAAGRVVGAVLSTTVIKTKHRVGKFIKYFSWRRGSSSE